jgi:hypothetical protein
MSSWRRPRAARSARTRSASRRWNLGRSKVQQNRD